MLGWNTIAREKIKEDREERKRMREQEQQVVSDSDQLIITSIIKNIIFIEFISNNTLETTEKEISLLPWSYSKGKGETMVNRDGNAMYQLKIPLVLPNVWQKQYVHKNVGEILMYFVTSTNYQCSKQNIEKIAYKMSTEQDFFSRLGGTKTRLVLGI